MSRRHPPVDVEYVRLDLVCPDDERHVLGYALRQDGHDGIWPKKNGLSVTVTAEGAPRKVEGRCSTCSTRRRPQLTWTRIVSALDGMEAQGQRHARLTLNH